MITPDLKDKILAAIQSNPEKNRLKVYNNFYPGVEDEVVFSIVRQFAVKGYVTILDQKKNGYLYIQYEAKADDFLRKGGHIMEDEIIDNELRKLELEIRKLQKDLDIHTYNTILASIGTIVGVFSALSK